MILGAPIWSNKYKPETVVRTHVIQHLEEVLAPVRLCKEAIQEQIWGPCESTWMIETHVLTATKVIQNAHTNTRYLYICAGNYCYWIDSELSGHAPHVGMDMHRHPAAGTQC